MTTHTLTNEHNGNEIEVSKGDILKITLKSNQTTGFKWEVAEVDGAIFEQQRSEYIAPNTNLVGAGGVHEFEYKVIGESGSHNLKLQYKRPWMQTTDTFFTLKTNLK
ncbi:inhibitor of cysteine peptidase [Anaeramoeba ignava]|uniref:Inhibitor of cysteine peptidase n=1 Tax=Anaeramoeba ignava TaxID=1746090 RepID=A0A9Q0R9H9_ANAIG|nr:inhibitor of cysteine peptidase [Anaeramoeba ignava]|eukprot:Anaeramoba_ignava/a18_6224.p3 GENE.a18_6224~~a18_6224.p3  ORF type:complete len:120 (-),score=47.65 a18_6224:1680-2000(-)